MDTQTYRLWGLRLDFNAKEQSIVVSRERIPGYMETMTMPYYVDTAKDLDGMKRGEAVQFVLTVDCDSIIGARYPHRAVR